MTLSTVPFGESVESSEEEIGTELFGNGSLTNSRLDSPLLMWPLLRDQSEVTKLVESSVLRVAVGNARDVEVDRANWVATEASGVTPSA